MIYRWLLAIFLLLMFFVPLFLLVVQSFAREWRFQMIFPETFTLQHWQSALSDPLVVEALPVTVLLTFGTVLLNFIIAFPAARVLAFYDFYGKAVVETMLLVPVLVPALAIAVGLHSAFLSIGLANSWLGVLLVYLLPTVPFTIRILKNGFIRIGSDLEAQAAVLGASRWQRFLDIIMPLMLPSVRAAAFLAGVIALSQYALTVTVGGGQVMALSAVYFPFAESANASIMAALSLLFSLLPLGLLLVFEGMFRLLFLNRVKAIRKG
ncbi:putative spermidine/putrescine transport system permease protein [Salsuginibacillus halophilus]|uniref:Putative spermidine/putrescine transport system permease protein n=1 Tax=Salsuginibacillus halophilus TaxID=517424 RepID=A0A2P8H8P6_9BACI|nr:ABC transporter permease subunit [Salsuginibacillus halophilus]PSL42603.1 putative spermidine/putrescine transport system permease protein [Salsuginibacillus halophilus]